jgi:hypothetical protein
VVDDGRRLGADQAALVRPQVCLATGSPGARGVVGRSFGVIRLASISFRDLIVPPQGFGVR